MASAEAGLSTEAWPPPPEYHWSTPRSVASLDVGGLEGKPYFFRHARWTADGTAVLLTAEDRVLRVAETDVQQPTALLPEPRAFPQPDAVNCAIWYPSASQATPEAFCFAASVRDTPVRLIDAADGRIRASYPIVDHRERFIAPHSMCFNTAADRLYCGFENAIEVFDVAKPGYDTSDRIKTCLTRKEKGGQRGIISALAFRPYGDGMFAAGSFSGSVALYDEDTGRATAHAEGVEQSGVTQLAFHPLDQNILFVSSRRSQAIQIFDLRDLSSEVGLLSRPASTNQRLAFDVDPWGRWLASGDEFGSVRVWDIGNADYSLLYEERLHRDAVNSVQFHAFEPLLLTAAGSRSYMDGQFVDDALSDSESGDGDEEAENKDAKMRIWSFQARA